MSAPNSFRLAPAPDTPGSAGAPFAPEQRLLLHVLLQALKDAASAHPQQRQEAQVWLQRSAECAELCEWLDLPHERIQQLSRQDLSVLLRRWDS
jgi:hypothetical protein